MRKFFLFSLCNLRISLYIFHNLKAIIFSPEERAENFIDSSYCKSTFQNIFSKNNLINKFCSEKDKAASFVEEGLRFLK
jgi:hypothetical protein